MADRDEPLRPETNESEGIVRQIQQLDLHVIQGIADIKGLMAVGSMGRASSSIPRDPAGNAPGQGILGELGPTFAKLQTTFENLYTILRPLMDGLRSITSSISRGVPGATALGGMASPLVRPFGALASRAIHSLMPDRQEERQGRRRGSRLTRIASGLGRSAGRIASSNQITTAATRSIGLEAAGALRMVPGIGAGAGAGAAGAAGGMGAAGAGAGAAGAAGAAGGMGAGLAAAAGPIGIAIAAVAAIGVVTVELAKLPFRLEDFGNGLVEANRRLAEFSPAMAAVIASKDIRDMMRDVEMGQRTAGSTGRLASATGDLSDELLDIKVIATNIYNEIGIVLIRIVEAGVELFKEFWGYVKDSAESFKKSMNPIKQFWGEAVTGIIARLEKLAENKEEGGVLMAEFLNEIARDEQLRIFGRTTIPEFEHRQPKDTHAGGSSGGGGGGGGGGGFSVGGAIVGGAIGGMFGLPGMVSGAILGGS